MIARIARARCTIAYMYHYLHDLDVTVMVTEMIDATIRQCCRQWLDWDGPARGLS